MSPIFSLFSEKIPAQ